MSDSDYLQPGFEPSSLTVPRLRSILVAHAIPYPSGAKKPQLIEIFTDNVVPQAPKILAQKARAKRTSRGITDAESSQESSTQESITTSNDDLVMPPPPTPRTRLVRKPSVKQRAADESESDVVPARSPTKKTPRASSKHARASDTETGTDLDGRRTVRKTRKSEAAPAPVPAPRIKREEYDDGAGVSRRESAFTFDNPFQSGSSPPEQRSVSGTRKSLGTSSTKRKGSSTRRRTDGPKVEDGFHPPTSATFEIPVRDLPGMKDVDENGVEASEEFTSEAQLELTHEQATDGALGPRRPKRKQTGGVGKSGPVWVVLLTLLGGYATWYRQEKVAVGYCGVGRDATQIVPAGVEVPDWVKTLAEPQCEPCPQHAYCYDNLETRCEPDFVLKPHPLSLGGLIPLTPTCEPDGEKVRRVKAVADRAVEELRERRAKWECGDLVDEAGVPEPTVEIDSEELKKEVSKKRRRGMGEAEFEELWAGAIGEIEGREEVVSAAHGFLIPSDPTSSSPAPHSPASPSDAPSDDPSDSLWRDIASKLLL